MHRFLNELKRSSTHLPHTSAGHTSKRQRVRSYRGDDEIQGQYTNVILTVESVCFDYLLGEDETDAGGATSDAETTGIDDAAEICNPLATTPSKVIEDTEGRRRKLIKILNQ